MPPEPPSRPRSLGWTSVLFLAVFLVLHLLWVEARDTAVERLWIDQTTVKAAAALVSLISPELGAYPEGPRIRAPGGGINVLNGCEGTDVLFLLCAAFVAFPMAWRRRIPGLLCGLLLTFCLNEIRILALFYAARSDKGLFDLLHTTVAPVILIALITTYFYAWIYRERPLATPA